MHYLWTCIFIGNLQQHNLSIYLSIYLYKRRQLKTFLTRFESTVPLTPDPSVICFWKFRRAMATDPPLSMKIGRPDRPRLLDQNRLGVPYTNQDEKSCILFHAYALKPKLSIQPKLKLSTTLQQSHCSSNWLPRSNL
jgi:hypothetical protein